MSWKPETDEIERRKRLALELGGEEAVARQHDYGKLTIRERIDRLADSGSFDEQGPQAGHAELDEKGRPSSFEPANYVVGIASIDGRRCVVGGEDFTQRGGSPSPAGLRKSIYIEELACRYRLPLIRFLEGGGGSVRGTAKGQGPTLSGSPVYATPRFASIARVLRTVPVVSAAMGAVAGLPAARLVASHFCVMTRKTSQVLIGGPALVERALGEVKTKEELGGAHVHSASGGGDRVAEDEDEVFELSRLYGRSQITALARLDGYTVGVLANDAHFLGGAMGAKGAQKVRRFIQLCQTFHLPIVSFVDEPGFMIGSASEAAGTIRYGVEVICATVESTVPWISIHVRKAYGVAAAAHFGPGGHILAWPSAESGALPIEGGVAVAFRREISEADDPEAKRRELEEEFAKGRSPFPRAESFAVHDLIDPRQTRPQLCRWIDLVQPLVSAEAHSAKP